jgi:prepilin-type N-terminal cleavage/methylation domain-containing protein
MLDQDSARDLGFTLMEILVSISILVIVVLLGGQFIIEGFDILRFQSEQEEVIQNARRAMNNLSLDLREARSSERGDYPLSLIQPQELVWYGDIDNDGEAERIRYSLSGSDLYRTVTEPGPLMDYTGAIATTTIASYVSNGATPVFTYYDSTNSETLAINQVRLVGVYLMVNINPDLAPDHYEIESYIHLRNLKDNL